MRVLVTGGLGQLGRELASVLGPEGHTPDIDEMDIEQPDLVRATIERFRPDAMIHAAAITDTRLCETDVGLAMRRNGTCSGAPADIAAAVGIRWHSGRRRKPGCQSDASVSVEVRLE